MTVRPALPNRPDARVLALPLALLLLCAASSAGAMEDATRWLDRMSRAMQNLNYQGTFVYLHGTELETMRIMHSRDESGERERLLSLNGEAREVIRDNNRVTCIWPGSRSVTVSKSRPRKPFPATIPEASRLAKQYRFTDLGEGRVADMPARIIGIEPLDQYRYGYRIWLDRETNLLLRSDLIDEHGKPVEQVMFTELKVLEHIPPEHFKPSLSGTGYTWVTDEDAAALAPDPMWKTTRIPDGFTLTSRSRRPMMPSDKAVEHLVFSDGLATVSLFIEPLSQDQERMEGSSRMGAVNVFGAIRDDYQVTVVGEVPPATVEYIGLGVVYNP